MNRRTALLGSASAVALMVGAAPALAETKVEVSGYVKADFIYNIDADVGDSFVFSSIPAEGSTADGRDGSFRAHARQSRFRIKSSTDTPMGPLTTHLEADFYGAGGNESFSNSNTLRLRHAYGTLGPWLFGQTWSNFMTLHAYPSSVDFFGPAGIPFARQAQLRYTFDAGSNVKVSLSLENPETDGLGTLGRLRESTGGLGFDELPDFTAKAQWSSGGHTVSVSGVARDLSVDDGGAFGAFDATDDEFGWGVHFAGAFSVLGDDTLMLDFTWGDGIGRYLINGAANDVFVTVNSAGTGIDLKTIESWGFVAGYDHVWSDTSHSTIAYGHFENEDELGNNFFVQSIDSLHINYFWSPVPNVTFGVEWIHGEIDFQAPFTALDNSANRVQFGAQFFF